MTDKQLVKGSMEQIEDLLTRTDILELSFTSSLKGSRPDHIIKGIIEELEKTGRPIDNEGTHLLIYKSWRTFKLYEYIRRSKQ